MTQKSGSPLRNFLDAFLDLRHLPRAFWFVIGAFVIDTMAYFGVLTLMTTYVSTGLGWGDTRAGITVSIFTMLVTLFMLGVGSYAEGFGLRRAILAALVLTTAGRTLYCLSPRLGMGAVITVLVIGSLLIVAMGEAILQPVCYSGIKQYTDEKTSSMGYGLIYAIMNLGIVAIGALSSWLRPGVQALLDGKAEADHLGKPVLAAFSTFSKSGVEAVNWACLGITALTLLFFFVLMTRKAEAAKTRPDQAQEMRQASAGPLLQRLKQFFAGGPFSQSALHFLHFHVTAGANPFCAPMAHNAALHFTRLRPTRGRSHGMARELDQPRHHFFRRAHRHRAHFARQCLYDDDRRHLGFGRAHTSPLLRTELAFADYLFRDFLDRRSPVVGALFGIYL